MDHIQNPNPEKELLRSIKEPMVNVFGVTRGFKIVAPGVMDNPSSF